MCVILTIVWTCGHTKLLDDPVINQCTKEHLETANPDPKDILYSWDVPGLGVCAECAKMFYGMEERLVALMEREAAGEVVSFFHLYFSSTPPSLQRSNE